MKTEILFVNHNSLRFFLQNNIVQLLQMMLPLLSHHRTEHDIYS